MEKSRNFGLDFEGLIDKSNAFYSESKIAFIYKKPTPIKIIKVDKNKIVDAVFEKKSTTDYNGIYNGYHIDFEAKSTVSEKFNLSSNIPQHQLDHLQNVTKSGGITFVLILFKSHNKIFLVPFENLSNVKKSYLGLEDCFDIGFEIEESLNPSIDYLKVVDLIIKEKYGK